MNNIHKLVVSNKRPQIEFWSTEGKGGWFLWGTYLDNQHAEESLDKLRANHPSIRFRLKPMAEEEGSQ